MLNGILIIDKQEGVSSAGVVGKIKHLTKDEEKYGKTRVGHFGTLDPFASGVLPIALGRATRLFKFHLNENKQYFARFYFGKGTNTYDTEGEFIKESSNLPSKDEISNNINSFIGQSLQKPPLFSAKSINGTRAYKLARAGIDFDLKEKLINIYSFDLLNQFSENEFDFRITCSAGTYIRGVCRDLAKLLDSAAYISLLRREQSGSFNLSMAKKIEEINNTNLRSFIYPLEKCLPGYEIIQVNKMDVKNLLDGKQVKMGGAEQAKTYRLISCEENIVGIGFLNEGFLVPETWLI